MPSEKVLWSILFVYVLVCVGSVARDKHIEICLYLYISASVCGVGSCTSFSTQTHKPCAQRVVAVVRSYGNTSCMPERLYTCACQKFRFGQPHQVSKATWYRHLGTASSNTERQWILHVQDPMAAQHHAAQLAHQNQQDSGPSSSAISLNLHLHRIRKADTPLCPHCKTTENVRHFLNDCPHYARARHVRRNELGRLADNIPYLLTNPEAIKPLIQYVNATGRLKNTFGNPHPHTTQ